MISEEHLKLLIKLHGEIKEMSTITIAYNISKLNNPLLNRLWLKYTSGYESSGSKLTEFRKLSVKQRMIKLIENEVKN